MIFDKQIGFDSTFDLVVVETRSLACDGLLVFSVNTAECMDANLS